MKRVMVAVILFPLRVVVFLVGFLAYWMEVCADWIVGTSGRTEYVRQGKCKRCGRCCRFLALIMPEGWGRKRRLIWFVSLWHRLVMNFSFVSDEGDWLVYRCNYYKEKGDGAGYCSIYPFRHRLCRFFPRQAIYGCPSLHKDCGFSFIRRSVLNMERRLKSDGRTLFSDVLSKKKGSSTADS